MKQNQIQDSQSPSQLIDAKISELSDWRGAMLSQLRALVKKADPEGVEEWKWSTPVWSHDGLICTFKTYKNAVKMTFANGAALEDPTNLFNSSLEGRTRRAIDFHERTTIDESALKALVQAAVTLNSASVRKPKKLSAKSTAIPATPKLLSGGNPQIAKGHGENPVQAYIAAMPEWKQDIGQRLDAIIERSVPEVNKAVKWNSPLYGIEGQGWFLGIHCFAKYVKVAFFHGVALRPLPPGQSKQQKVRYLDIRETDELDEAQFADWVKQASQLPGERM